MKTNDAQKKKSEKKLNTLLFKNKFKPTITFKIFINYLRMLLTTIMRKTRSKMAMLKTITTTIEDRNDCIANENENDATHLTIIPPSF